MTLSLTSILQARSNTLDEFPWLTPSRRKRRKARFVRYGRAALVLSLLAAPQILAIAFGAKSSAVSDRAMPQSKVAGAKANVIDAPFAPKSLRVLSAQDAELWNARIRGNPLASAPARPLAISFQSATFSRSLECLSAAVYYEAGNEPLDGQRAVAQVVLNRMRHPEYPHTVCGVVFQGAERRTGCQFSFTCDGSLQRKPSVTGWRDAQAVAIAALQGFVYAPVGWSTHYHADYVVPYWAQGLQKLVTVGRHIFYRWGGAAGEGASFNSKVQAGEPDIALIQVSPDSPVSDPLLSDGVKRIPSVDRPIIAAQSSTTSYAAIQPVPDGVKATPTEIAPSAPSTQIKPGDRWIIASPGQ